MKKIVCIITSLLLVLALVACDININFNQKPAGTSAITTPNSAEPNDPNKNDNNNPNNSGNNNNNDNNNNNKPADNILLPDHR